MTRINDRSFLILLSALVILVFGSALWAGFLTWDDNVLLSNNPALRLPFGEALKIFFSRFIHGDFIPLTLLSYWLELKLAGGAPTAWLHHFSNLALHLTNLLLVFSILRALRFAKPQIYFITLVFALHPLQVESVMWISERKGLGATLFALLAFWMVIRSSDSSKPGLLTFGYIVMYVLSLGFKASAIFLPLLALTYDFLFLKSEDQRTTNLRIIGLKHLLPITLMIAFSVLRFQAYAGGVTSLQTELWSTARLGYLPLEILAAVGHYISKFFLPIHLSPIYLPFSLSWTWVAQIIVGGLALAATSLIVLWRRSPLNLFFITWFFIFLLPVLQIVPRINFVNDRYMYLPILGLAYFISLAKDLRLPSVLAVLMVPSTFLVGLTWVDNLKFWAHTVEQASWSALAENNLALEFHDRNRLDEAVAHYEKALTLGRSQGMAPLVLNNLGIIYSNRSNLKFFNLEKARAVFQEGIDLATQAQDTFELKFNLGLTLEQLGRDGEAQKVFKNLRDEIESYRSDSKYESLVQLIQSRLKN